jgi:CheY-like chemotaxis protein
MIDDETPRAPRQIAHETAREMLETYGFAAARIWLVEPPERSGNVAEGASAGSTVGGLTVDRVAEIVRGGSAAAMLIAHPANDSRFTAPLPGGAFLGMPLTYDDGVYGYVETYASGEISFTVAAQIEAHLRGVGEVLASARATQSLESSKRGKVLVADDDPGIRSLLKLLLARRGFDVLDVANGLLAFELAKREQPDLVLLDWVMPIMDGREATLKLKSDAATRHIPIVMLTSQSRIDDKVSALEAGAQDFLTKPFDSRELVARIEQQMRWRKLLSAESDGGERAPVASAARAPLPLAAVPAPGITGVLPNAPNAPKGTSAPDPPLELSPELLKGDVWQKAVEAAQLGKHREALALYMHEAERCDNAKLYPRAAIAYRSASVSAGQMRNLDLSNKLLRLAGKMYLSWSETSQDTKAIQEAYLNAARCFLSSGNLKLAKKSIDFAHSYEAVIADDRPPSLAGATEE